MATPAKLHMVTLVRSHIGKHAMVRGMLRKRKRKRKDDLEQEMEWDGILRDM